MRELDARLTEVCRNAGARAHLVHLVAHDYVLLEDALQREELVRVLVAHQVNGAAREKSTLLRVQVHCVYRHECKGILRDRNKSWMQESKPSPAILEREA